MSQDIVKPIRPAEAKKKKEENWKQNLPAPVLEAINDTIIKHIEPGSFTITQDAMMKAILDELAEGRKEWPDETNMPWYYKATRQQVFDNHWLDFEPMLRKSGWKVNYDKPAYYESYDANWHFSH